MGDQRYGLNAKHGTGKRDSFIFLAIWLASAGVGWERLAEFIAAPHAEIPEHSKPRIGQLCVVEPHPSFLGEQDAIWEALAK